MNRFKLCEFHKEGAEVPYKIITLRNMTKVVKIENNPENERKIRNLAEKRPIQTKGYSLGSTRKVIIASYEKVTPPNLPILNNLESNLETEICNVKNEPSETSLNVENNATENNDEYFHKKLDMSRGCSRNILEPENQYVDCDVNDLYLQSLTPGLICNPMTSFHDPNNMEPGERLLVTEPNLEQAAEVLGKRKLSLENYKKLKSPSKFVLEEHIGKLANDKVWNAWNDALKLLFNQKGVDDPDGLIDMIVTMIKINCNVYMHGSEFLLKYQGARHDEDHNKMINMQKDVLTRFQLAMESSVKETLSHKDVLSYLAKELKEYKALPEGDAEMADDEAEPPKKKVKQDDQIAIPYGDSCKTYSRAECKEMIDLYEDAKAKKAASASAALLATTTAATPARTLFTIGAPGPSGSGRGGGRGGRNARGGYAQQRMDSRRQENLRGAAGAKFTIEQIINLGKTSTCPEDARIMAEKAKKVLQKKIDNVLASKAKLVYNSELGTHVPPTTADIPAGHATIPDDILRVFDKPKNGEEGYCSVKELKERLTAQFGKHLWYE